MAYAFDKRTFCVITGASRGLGAALAQALAQKCAPRSTFVLIARNQADLKKVSEECIKLSPKSTIDAVELDLSDVCYQQYDDLFKKYSEEKYEQAILVHNAATVGPLGKTSSQLDDVDELRKYFDMNFHSTVLLNSAFFKHFTKEQANARFIVNVSSGAAYGGFKGMHIYAAAKCARDGFFRVFAIEDPMVRVLNFNPGPIVTDMQREVQREAYAEEVKAWSKEGTSSGNFPTAQKAADKLVEIIHNNVYESGSFVNIHDK